MSLSWQRNKADISKGRYCFNSNNPIRLAQPRSLPYRVSNSSEYLWHTPLMSPLSRLDNANRERMRHLRCLCFVRPSPDSIQQLIDEFREPKYGEYMIC